MLKLKILNKPKTLKLKCASMFPDVVLANLQEKTIKSSIEQQIIKADRPYDGLSKVIVEALESETLNIKPTLEEQKYVGVYGEVNVEPANEVFEQGSISTPFYYATRLDNVCGGQTFPENYEAVIRLKKAPAYCGYIFNNSINYKTLTMISEDKTNIVDISALCSVSAARKNETALEKIDLRDFNKKFSNMINFAQYQTKLKSILGALDLSECKNVTNWLRECTALEDIEIEPNTIKLSISAQHSTLLTKESLLSIMNGLSTTVSGQILSLSKTAVNNAFETSDGAGDGSTSNEWNTLVATRNNWTITLI